MFLSTNCNGTGSLTATSLNQGRLRANDTGPVVVAIPDRRWWRPQTGVGDEPEPMAAANLYQQRRSRTGFALLV